MTREYDTKDQERFVEVMKQKAIAVNAMLGTLSQGEVFDTFEFSTSASAILSVLSSMVITAHQAGILKTRQIDMVDGLCAQFRSIHSEMAKVNEEAGEP